MKGRLLIPALLGALLLAEPALADGGDSLLRQILVMWFPLLLFVALWIIFVRKSGIGRDRKLIERSLDHMDALEAKLDRVIELLERGSSR